MTLIADIVAQAPALTAIRRDLHAHPELGFEEVRTSDLIARKLSEWGIEVHRGLGKTGVVGTIVGRQGESNRAVGLRADMDALPMQELNRFAHVSQYPGKMHACGHDGHTTMLLGAAQYLAATRHFDGRVQVIFQPAEEFGGGGQVMIQDGLFEKFPVEAVFGLHNMPGIAEGTFASSAGPVLASNSEFKICIHGKGGHAAMPHLALDPIPVASQMMQAFQTIISRNRQPLEEAVISVTTIHAGDSFNIIPQTCELSGTVRAYSRATLDLIERRMGEIAQHTAAAYGVRCDFQFNRLYPATVNHVAESALAREVLVDLLGPQRVIEQTPIMAAEDFSFMLEAVPGSYCFIGQGDGSHRAPGHAEGPCNVHNPSYDFNDALLPIGASFLARVAERWLAQPRA